MVLVGTESHFGLQRVLVLIFRWEGIARRESIVRGGISVLLLDGFLRRWTVVDGFRDLGANSTASGDDTFAANQMSEEFRLQSSRIHVAVTEGSDESYVEVVLLGVVSVRLRDHVPQGLLEADDLGNEGLDQGLGSFRKLSTDIVDIHFQASFHLRDHLLDLESVFLVISLKSITIKLFRMALDKFQIRTSVYQFSRNPHKIPFYLNGILGDFEII